jgi:predicted MFS family arabinose efflux permease
MHDAVARGALMETEAAPATRYAWYMVAVLCIAYTLSFVDRMILALLVEPIKRDLGVTDTQIGLLHGFAFAIFYTTLGLPIARLADRTDRRRLIAIGVAFWSAMTAVCGLARNFWELFFARVGVGVGEAALSPAAYSMLADSFPPNRLGRALGVYSSAIYAGAGVALLVGGSIAAVASGTVPVHVPLLGEIRPWQIAFLVVGAPGLLVALWILSLREPPRRGAAKPQAEPIRNVVGWLRTHSRAYGCHFAGFALLALVFNATIAWMPSVFVRVHGWTAGHGAFWIGMALILFGTSGIIAGGMSADAWRRKGRPDGSMRVGLTSALGVLPFAAAAPVAPSPAWTVALLAPLMFFSAFAFGAAAAGLQWLTPPTMRAQVSALFLFVNNLVGIGVGPVAVALLTDRVFGVPASVGTSLAIVGAAAAGLAALAIWPGIRAFDEGVRSRG